MKKKQIGKQARYKFAHEQINKSIEQGFYLEAISIEESIIKDRLFVYWVNERKEGGKKGRSRLDKTSHYCLKAWNAFRTKSNLPQVPERIFRGKGEQTLCKWMELQLATKKYDGDADDLFFNIKQWLDNRNKALHETGIIYDDEEDEKFDAESAKVFNGKCKEYAITGNQLMKRIKAKAEKAKRANRSFENPVAIKAAIDDPQASVEALARGFNLEQRRAARALRESYDWIHRR
ncbi:hypothetical protein OMCYN_01749 [cyanobiont of Ornithocercus magnificus]|nr:hypothetical protein OMCYN_01749 [cyanobiont of Ornithocercus magnificus]